MFTPESSVWAGGEQARERGPEGDEAQGVGFRARHGEAESNRDISKRGDRHRGGVRTCGHM